MLTDETPSPLNHHVHIFRVPLDVNHHSFDKATDDFFAIDGACGRRLPQSGKVVGQSADPFLLGLGEIQRCLLAKAVVLLLLLPFVPQRLLPLLLQRPCNQSVLRIDRPVAALGLARFISSPFQLLLPMTLKSLSLLLDVFGTHSG